MTIQNNVRTWADLSDQEQVYLWWDYNAANPESPVSFSIFDEMMQGITFE